MSSIWTVGNRGFLPDHEPLSGIRIRTGLWANDYVDAIDTVNILGINLPNMASKRYVRDQLVLKLNSCTNDLLKIISSCRDDDVLEYLFRYLTYFASMYVHAPFETTANRLPRQIAEPLLRLAILLKREPILSYSNYCLYNWQRINPNNPIELGNIRLIQNFSFDAKRDEDWFILVHVDIEAKAARVINSIKNIQAMSLKEERNIHNLFDNLKEMAVGLEQMCNTLDRMPEQCSPEVYYKSVRPYIFGFNEVFYEATHYTNSVSGVSKTLRGETGAQSSIIPAVQIALGVQHKDSLLTNHLKDMRAYMPAPHRSFLAVLEENKTIRDMILEFDPIEKIDVSPNPDGTCWATGSLESQIATTLNRAALKETKKTYNQCIELLSRFRNTHLKYAVEYIQKKVENPNGTGGTPYIPWLSQLAKETDAYILPVE